LRFSQDLIDLQFLRACSLETVGGFILD